MRNGPFSGAPWLRHKKTKKKKRKSTRYFFHTTHDLVRRGQHLPHRAQATRFQTHLQEHTTLTEAGEGVPAEGVGVSARGAVVAGGTVSPGGSVVVADAEEGSAVVASPGTFKTRSKEEQEQRREEP